MMLTIALRYYLLLFAITSAPFCNGLALSSPSSSSSSSSLDRQQVLDQLGYVPGNFLSVVGRSADGTPVVLQTYPLAGGSARRQARSSSSASAAAAAVVVGTPFPTLYWLCHPAIHKAVADLERRGHVQRIEQEICASPALSRDLIECHQQYAADRWRSLTQPDRAMLLRSDETSMASRRNILQYTGVAGTNVNTTVTRQVGSERNRMFIPSVKCLHAHYAQYRASSANSVVVNPVGKMVHELLQAEFPSLIL